MLKVIYHLIIYLSFISIYSSDMTDEYYTNLQQEIIHYHSTWTEYKCRFIFLGVGLKNIVTKACLLLWKCCLFVFCSLCLFGVRRPAQSPASPAGPPPRIWPAWRRPGARPGARSPVRSAQQYSRDWMIIFSKMRIRWRIYKDMQIHR